MNDVDNVRQAIADALTAIPDVGLRGSLKRPTVMAQGAAWPRLSAVSRDSNNYLFRTWEVFVILPQQEDAASQWFDDHGLDILDALSSETLYIDSMAPVMVPITVNGQTNALFAMLLTGRE